MTKEFDKIFIDELRVFAHHGVLPEETRDGQEFILNMVLLTDTSIAGRSDDLDDTLNYAEICYQATDIFTGHAYKLIEAAAENLARQLLAAHPALSGITVEVRKPHAPIEADFGCVSVKITRMRHTAYIALGSNIGDSESLINDAVKKLDSEPFCQVSKVSTLIRTAPYGVTDQPDFLNGALELKTLLSPDELLQVLHRIEAEAGRERIIRWGPRTLDLDIILFDDLVISTEDLSIPHIEMELRDFVLKPMAEIAPYLRHPVSGKTMAQLLRELV